MPYSPEFQTSGTARHFLNLLAHAGGGIMLGPNAYASTFSQNLPSVYAAIPITFWLFALAALLLPIDIALRRLSSLEFLAVGYQWMSSRIGLRKAMQKKDSTDNLVLGTIRAFREDRKSRTLSFKPKDSPMEPGSTNGQVQLNKRETQTMNKQNKSAQNQQEVSMTGKLLEAKRKRTSTKEKGE